VSTSVGHDVVSAGSPVGRALLGRAPGETVVVELPRGRVERLAILGVSPAEPATA
jgi:transcription elongation GreA/GreB family factor